MCSLCDGDTYTGCVKVYSDGEGEQLRESRIMSMTVDTASEAGRCVTKQIGVSHPRQRPLPRRGISAAHDDGDDNDLRLLQVAYLHYP